MGNHPALTLTRNACGSLDLGVRKRTRMEGNWDDISTAISSAGGSSSPTLFCR